MSPSFQAKWEATPLAKAFSGGSWRTTTTLTTKAMASILYNWMESNLEAMASLRAMASNLPAMASNLIAMASSNVNWNISP